MNLIDGLDGLCAGMGLVATLALFTAALLHGNHPLAYATFPLAGALVGFLCHNINPATVFLGDSGALLIGFLLGCYGMIWTQKSSTLLSMLVPLLALSIPLLDVSLSVLRRFLRNQPIFSADRGHIHHRLLRPRVFAAAGRIGVVSCSRLWRPHWPCLPVPSSAASTQSFIILLFCLAAWVGIQNCGYPELDIAGRLLFRGEFQRTMAVKLRIEALTAALERASTDDRWWEALLQGLAVFDLAAIRWISGGAKREHRRPEAAATWSFRVQPHAGGCGRAGGRFFRGSGRFLILWPLPRPRSAPSPPIPPANARPRLRRSRLCSHERSRAVPAFPVGLHGGTCWRACSDSGWPWGVTRAR